MEQYHEGGFTMPGEAGYEQLTLELAKKWGADVIRDSDGTKLSPEIVEAGYKIYSTLCVIREHNAFAEKHLDAQQQTFLSSDPICARDTEIKIALLDGYFTEQFVINEAPDSLAFWQVWDRTCGKELPRDQWAYADGTVTVKDCVPYHLYTVSFLCYRIWEEINMYNHTTNHWTSEHLRQLDPRHPEAWAYLLDFMDRWCQENPQTDVVRLTSLFYNFVWIFGDSDRRRSRFVDWASYDFTVSPAALKAFEKEYGYALTAEDFINQGKLQATHRVPTSHKRDYMDFTSRFVAERAKALVDIIHRYGKQAYVFYDDSWVGMEPYGKYFAEVGFDGLIKCVFSGFECRLCAGAKVPVHEIRFHPYLFPVGLGGLPTFSEGGHPEKDAYAYWAHVRRALARECVDRIGLGGYLHLTVDYPAFQDAIEEMAIHFRHLKALHAQGAPSKLDIRVGVLHTWGSLRSWTLSGHFHETDQNVLIHINEALSGLPVDVRFLSFEDVLAGGLEGIDVLINAGREGDAWSGGEVWKNADLQVAVARFVDAGGHLIGVREPTAVAGNPTRFALAHVLGVDQDTGDYACHAPWTFEVSADAPCQITGSDVLTSGIRLIDPATQVYQAVGDTPVMTYHTFGKGSAVYMGGFAYSPENARMLLNLLLFLTGKDAKEASLCDHPMAESAWFPASKTLVVMNNAEETIETTVTYPLGEEKIRLEPMETRFVEKE